MFYKETLIRKKSVHEIFIETIVQTKQAGGMQSDVYLKLYAAVCTSTIYHVLRRAFICD